MAAIERGGKTESMEAMICRHLSGFVEPHAKLNGVDASDLFRMLAVLAAEYGEPDWWDEVEDASSWSIVPRLAPAAAALLRHRAPDEALALVAREDLKHACERDVLIRELQGESRFLTIDELADRLDAFHGYLVANREALLATGLPETAFDEWPAPLLVNHLCVKRPANYIEELFSEKRRSGTRSWQWARPAAADEDGEPIEMLSTKRRGAEARWVACSYDEAPILVGMDQAIADRFVAGRPHLFELKRQVLERLARALRSGDAVRLWPECWRLVTDAVTADDMALYLAADRSADVLLSDSLAAGRGMHPTFPGGLTELLAIIGHCEKELTLGALDRTKRMLLPHLPEPDERFPFYGPCVATLGTPDGGALEAALHLYDELKSEEPAFWSAYQTRVEVVRTQFFGDAFTADRAQQQPATPIEPDGRSLAEPDGRHPGMKHRPQNVFRRAGTGWTIQFEGQRIQLKDSKGLRYLAHLLRHPGQEFHVLDLVRVVDDAGSALVHTPSGGASGAGECASGFTVGFGDAGEFADEQAKRELKQELLDMEEEIGDAEAMGDVGRMDKLKDDREQIMDYLKQVYGLGGRDRIAAEAGERARVKITQAIRRARAEIKTHHPALAAHLNHIKTGFVCSYDIPAHAAPSWDF